MDRDLNLHALEKKSVTTIFQTGFIEITMGLILLVISMAMIFDQYSYYIDIFLFVPIVFIIVALRSIAYPRIGIVQFTSFRVRKRLAVFIPITTLLVVMILLRFLNLKTDLNNFLNPRLFLSSVIFLILTSTAIALEFRRMYLYSILFVGVFNLSEEIREHSWFIKENGFAYLFASAVLILTGIIYLIRFLKNNPLPKFNPHE